MGLIETENDPITNPENLKIIESHIIDTPTNASRGEKGGFSSGKSQGSTWLGH